MKQALLAGTVLMAILVAGHAGTNQYVSTNGTAVSPYTNWAEAATNLAQVLTATANGNTIIVSNGVYRPTATTMIGKSVTITSLYGAAQTVIDGGSGVFAGLTIASASVTATVYGLTITNFWGGGISINPGTLTLDTCIVSGNTNSSHGGGIYAAGAGALYVTNCTIIGNTVPLNRNGGGLAAYCSTTRVDNSFIRLNYAGFAGIYGAGFTTIRNCTIANNWGSSPPNGGGGVYLSAAASAARSLIANSTIVSNSGANNGGGIHCDSSDAIVEDCLLAWNISWTGGGVYNEGAILRNCTIVYNSTGNGRGGIRCYPSPPGGGTNVNCIVYFNSPDNYEAGFYTNTCTTPLPAGPGNTAANPKFTNSAAGNFRLAKGSPCIDTGLYQTWMDTAVDLDGRPRIRQGTQVDMGAYEYFSPRGTIVMIQ